MWVTDISLQETRAVPALAPRSALFILLLSSIILFSTVDAHTQATYSQGLPTIGKTGTVAVPGRMAIDALQFLNPLTAPDICAAIAAACQSSNTPVPTTIDARGFTGDQVCAANNATQMLNGCAANGGKLLLGTVHLYADGPTGGINGHYDDGHSSGAGTPAFIIPNKFWGIEGVSRGSGESAVGTFLSVCLGPNNPIGGTNACHNSFPVRSFTVNAATVSTAGGVTTMTMTVSPALNWGVNIYSGELAMMKGNTSPASENGTYKIQNGSPDTTVKVTVAGGPDLSS